MPQIKSSKIVYPQEILLKYLLLKHKIIYQALHSTFSCHMGTPQLKLSLLTENQFLQLIQLVKDSPFKMRDKFTVPQP
jgi:hypothetical protein